MKDTKNNPATAPVSSKKKRKWGWIAVSAVLILALVAGGFFFRRNRGPGAAFGTEVQERVITETAQKGSIDTVLSTAGSISEAEGQAVTYPEGIKLTSLLVKNGSEVRAGDALAYVDPDSVLSRIMEVQELLDQLDADLEDAREDEISDTLKASAPGRVKVVYAAEGDDVRQVMLEKGALALISLDGQMTVEIETDAALSVGESVTMKTSDGTEYSAKVSEKRPGALAITVSDEKTTYGDAVTVYDENGSPLGGGTLSIHSEQRITGFSGTVKQVKISVGQKVSKNASLFTLKDTGYSAGYETLLNRRHELEEKLQALFILYQSGTLCAETDGIIRDLDESLADQESDKNASTEETASAERIARPGEALLSVRTDAFWEGSDAQLLGASRSSSEMLLAEEGEIPGGEGTGGMGVGGDMTGYFGGMDFSGFDFSSFGGYGGGSQGGAAVQEETAEEVADKYSLAEATLCTVVPRETVIVTVTVDELDILSLSPGDEAQITLDALVGQRFTGHVTKIGREGTNAGGSTKFQVEVTVDRTASMYVGMNAAVNFVQGTHGDVVIVPAAALQEDGNRTFVYTAYDEKNDTLLNPVAVETGVSDGQQVEILSGLAAGDAYCYRYADTILWSFQR